MKELQAIVGSLMRAEQAGVLATLTSVEGSSYRRPGARMLISDDGSRLGSISGGCLEEDLTERSRRVAASGSAELVVYDTTVENDIVWGVGLGCHGIVRILLERVPPRPDWVSVLAENLRTGRATDLVVVWEESEGPVGTRLRDDPKLGRQGSGHGVFRERIEPPTSLTIFGAGDDAQPLSRMALELGWRVSVADPRSALLNEQRFPGVAALVLGPPDELVARAAPFPGSLAVVMTHHYRHDVPLMSHLLPLPLAYLGLLGPKRRADKILSEMAEMGLVVTPAMRSRVRAPVGLDLGADAPEEVALSIIAEMSAVLSGRDARPLRDRERPIHA
jgi:xanthine dehydrogenase accessory factor